MNTVEKIKFIFLHCCVGAVFLLLISPGTVTGAEELLQGWFIDEIRIEGLQTIHTEGVSSLKSRYQGRELFLEDFVALRDQITQLYLDSGHITSGAVISEQEPQTLANGVFVLEIIEGQVPQANFEQAGLLLERDLREVYEDGLSNPLNIEQLSSLITVLESDKRVQSIQGSLKPGADLGGSQIDLIVNEADLFAMSIGVNNYLSPSVGSEQLEFGLSHLNLTGRADELFLNLNKSEGVEGASLVYNYPLPLFGLTLQSLVSAGDTVVVEEPFDDIDVRSDTDTAGLKLSKSFRLAGLRSLSISAGIEKKSSTTSLLGEPFDFSPGSIAGKSRASIATASVEYRQQSADQALIARMSWRHGADLWDATIRDGQADGRFDSFVAQFQYVIRIPDLTVISVRSNAQFTRDSLQAFERLALGGHDSVRGFRENQLLKDNGWELLLESEFAVPSPIDFLEVSLVPFLGHARAWNSEAAANVNRDGYLSSAGISLRLRAEPGLNVTVGWAQRLNRRTRQADELQDYGLHIGVRYEF